METEFCAWKAQRALFSLMLVLAAVSCSSSQPQVKVYPRGNHWAVGHLMGKKSVNGQFSTEKSFAGNRQNDPEDLKDESSRLLTVLMKILPAVENQDEELLYRQRKQDTSGQDKSVKEMAEVISQVLKENGAT